MPPTHVADRSVFAPGSLGVFAQWHRHEGDRANHDHEFFEIALVLGGAARHITIYEERNLQRGDVVLVCPNAWHGYRDCKGFEILICYLSVDMFRRELAWLRNEFFWRTRLRHVHLSSAGSAVNILRPEPHHFQACVKRLSAIRAENRGVAPGSACHVLGNLLLFLDILMAEKVDETADGIPNAEKQAVVRRAVRLLEENFSAKWSLRTLSECLNGVSHSHLVRAFRRATSLTPMAYLARLRLERAATLLLTTDLSVTEIAFATGWSDSNLLARRFRLHFGQTPTGFRRRRLGRDL